MEDYKKLLESINDKLDAILARSEMKDHLSADYQSDKIDLISAAFVKAQGEFDLARKNRTNSFLKSEYADITSLMMATRPHLAKYGLGIRSFEVQQDDGSVFLHTRLVHSSGQWMETRSRILSGKTDQEYGKALTYKARYAIRYLLGIPVENDTDDDDGNEQIYKHETTRITGKPTYAPKKELNPGWETVTPEQLKELQLELSGYPELAKEVLDGYKIATLADFPKESYSAGVRRIREIKAEMSKAN